MSNPSRKQKPPAEILPLGPAVPSRKRAAEGEQGESKKGEGKTSKGSSSSTQSASSSKQASTSSEGNKKARLGDASGSSESSRQRSDDRNEGHQKTSSIKRIVEDSERLGASGSKVSRVASVTGSPARGDDTADTLTCDGGVSFGLRTNGEFVRVALLRLDEAAELSNDGCATLLATLEEARDPAATEATLLAALRHVRACRAAARVPHPALTCALLVWAKERAAHAALPPPLLDVACAILCRDAAPAPAAALPTAAAPGGPANNATRKKLGAAVCALIANFLYAALAATPNWPTTTLRAYLDDALGERTWVDRPDSLCFVENLETAFGTARLRPTPDASLVSDTAAHAQSGDWSVSARFETVRERLVPELGEAVAECVQRRLSAAQPSSSALMRIQLGGVLRVLMAASGLPSVRALATQPAFLEQCLAHAELLRPTLDLLATVALNLRLAEDADADADDANALANLVRVRLKKIHVAQFLGCLATLIDRDSRFVDAIVHHAVAHELASPAPAPTPTPAPKPAAPPTNLLPVCALLFARANDRASRALARCLFTAALARSPLDLRPLRSIVREACKPGASLLSSWLAPAAGAAGTLPSWALAHAGATSSFDPVAFTQALVATFDQHSQPNSADRRRDAVRCVVELTVVCVLSCAFPALRDACSAHARGTVTPASAQNIRSGLLQISAIQGVAVAWLLRSAAHLPPSELYTHVRTVLFLHDHPDSDELFYRTSTDVYFADGWPSEPDRAAALRLCGQVPLMNDTLCALLDFAAVHRARLSTSQPPPYTAGGGTSIMSPYETHANHVSQIVTGAVLRCLPLAALRIPELDAALVRVERPDVVDLLLALAHVALDKVTSGGRLVVASRFWKVAKTLVVLTAYNAHSVGREVWSRCATVRVMIEMCIVNSFAFPPACGPSATSEVAGVDERQVRALERDAIAALEATLRSRCETTSTLQLPELLLVDESVARAPPASVLLQLARLNETGRLDLAFCRQRDPDLVLELLARGRAAPPIHTGDSDVDEEAEDTEEYEPHFEAHTEAWIVRLVQNADADLLDSLPVECLCEFAFAAEWLGAELSDDPVDSSDLEEHDSLTIDTPLPQAVSLCLARIRQRMNASSADTLAVARFSADRLRARHAAQRRKARALLAALASDGPAIDWLDDTTRATCWTNALVEPVLLEAVGRSLMVETDVSIIIRSLRYLRCRLDAHLTSSAPAPQVENVVVAVACSLCIRHVLRTLLERHADALEPIFSLFLSYLRVSASRTHRDRHTSPARLVAMRWNAAALAADRKAQLVLDRRVLCTTLYLLTVPHTRRDALAAFWLPPDGTAELPTPFAIVRPNARADVLRLADAPLAGASLARLYPVWLVARLVSCFEIHRSLALVRAAVRAVPPCVLLAALHALPDAETAPRSVVAERLVTLTPAECDTMRCEVLASTGHSAWQAACRRIASLLDSAAPTVPNELASFIRGQLSTPTSSRAVRPPPVCTIGDVEMQTPSDTAVTVIKIEPSDQLAGPALLSLQPVDNARRRAFRLGELLDRFRQCNVIDWIAADPQHRVRALFATQCEAFVGQLLHDYDLPAIQRLVNWLLDTTLGTTESQANDDDDAQFCTVALNFIANAHSLPRFWLGCERESTRLTSHADASCVSVSARQLARLAQFIVREALPQTHADADADVASMQLARMANRVRFCLLPFVGHAPSRSHLRAVVSIVRQCGSRSPAYAAAACRFSWLVYQFCPQLGTLLPMGESLNFVTNSDSDIRLPSVAGPFDRLLERLLFDFCSPLSAYVAPEYQQAARSKVVGGSGVGVVGVSGTPSAFGVALDVDRLRRGNILLRAIAARHPLLVARHLQSALSHVTHHATLYSFAEFQRRRFDTLHIYLLNLLETSLPWFVEFDARRIELLAPSSAPDTAVRPNGELDSIVLGYLRVCFALLNTYRAVMCREMGSFVVRFLRVLAELRTLLAARCAAAYICARCGRATRLAQLRTLLLANVGVLHGLRELFADSETLHNAISFTESASANTNGASPPDEGTCRCLNIVGNALNGDAQLLSGARKRESAFQVHRFLKRFADRRTTQLELVEMLKDLDESSLRRVDVLERFQSELKALVSHQHSTVRELATNLAMRFVHQYPQRASEFHDAFVACLRSSSPACVESTLRVLPEFAVLNYERGVEVMCAAFDSLVRRSIADDSCTFLDDAFALLSASTDDAQSQ